MQMQWQLTPEGQWILGGIAAGLVAACTAVAVLLWLQGRRFKRLDARVAQFGAALALFTDTVEGGFQDLLRQAPHPLPEARTAVAPRLNTRRRIRSAAKRGRTVDQIAATEHLSEGEVRLMLQMSGASSEHANHAEMR
jgi:hypothetical protein